MEAVEGVVVSAVGVFWEMISDACVGDVVGRGRMGMGEGREGVWVSTWGGTCSCLRFVACRMFRKTVR